jgi:hypothetical protein
VLSQLSKSHLLESWKSCLQRESGMAARDGPLTPPPPPKDLSELLGQNEVVWRMSAFGWLISALLQNVIANHAVPAAIIRLIRVQRAVDDLVHCCAEVMLQNDVYATPSTVPYETRFTQQVRSCVGPLSGMLKQQMAQLDDEIRAWEENPPRKASGSAETSPGISPTTEGKNRDFAGGGAAPVVSLFSSAYNAALGQADAIRENAAQRVHQTRLSLASVIRSKVAAVTAMKKAGEGADHRDDAGVSAKDRATAAVEGPRTTLAATALDVLGKRAAAALQGTNADVGMVAEILRAWWHHMPDRQRIGDGDNENLNFKVTGDETVLRLAFGVPELAEHFTDDPNVVGNKSLRIISNSLRHLLSNPVLKAALVTKPARVAHIVDWTKMAPPVPSAVIKHLVTEHSKMNSMSIPRQGSKGSYLLQIADVTYQTHRELEKNLLAAGRYAKEALGVAIRYESAMENLATAALIKRFEDVGYKEIALPSTTLDGKMVSPVALAFTAFEALSAAVHGSLAAHYHLLSATLPRADDSVAHLGLAGDEDTPSILHCVARLYECHAEWRRWRVALHRECAIAAAEVVDVCFNAATMNVGRELWPPPTCQPDPAVERKRHHDAKRSAKERGTPGGGAAAPVIARRGRRPLVQGRDPGAAAARAGVSRWRPREGERRQVESPGTLRRAARADAGIDGTKEVRVVPVRRRRARDPHRAVRAAS